METYHGHVRTPADAIILFEACRVGLLPRVQRRLSEKERQSIRSGSIFVWDEREAGMRRWTDGKSWSASRVSGSFLTYREMEGKRGGNGLSTPLFSGNAPKGRDKSGDPDSNDDGPDGYRYKPDGLMKQSFSITTSSGQHLHLISYYSRTASASQNLMQPSNDPQLRHIRPEKGMYPESTVHDHNSIPAVTRGPMAGSPMAGSYATSPHQVAPMASPYGRQAPAGYSYPGWAPPSPLHTPPPHYQHYYGTQQHHYAPHYSHVPQSYAPQYPPVPQQTAYDRAPAPLSNTSLPLPAPQQPHQQPSPYNYQSMSQQHSPLPQPQQQPTPNGSISSDPKLSDARHDSVHPRPTERKSATPPAVVTSSATTIPSISALINGAQTAPEEQRRSGSVSPTSKTGRQLQDIPLHKLGFNPGSDARALSALDKATFRI
ncbi:cAMP-independent regulatory protein pac2-like protein [Elsinoe fawcettii]|nr:cAMP-independent regulatory protein pac2-like protein [Elsinoe fawcettii]